MHKFTCSFAILARTILKTQCTKKSENVLLILPHHYVIENHVITYHGYYINQLTKRRIFLQQNVFWPLRSFKLILGG